MEKGKDYKKAADELFSYFVSTQIYVVGELIKTLNNSNNNEHEESAKKNG